MAKFYEAFVDVTWGRFHFRKKGFGSKDANFFPSVVGFSTTAD